MNEWMDGERVFAIKKGFGYLISNVNDDFAGFDRITDGGNSFGFYILLFFQKETIEKL